MRKLYIFLNANSWVWLLVVTMNYKPPIIKVLLNWKENKRNEVQNLSLNLVFHLKREKINKESKEPDTKVTKKMAVQYFFHCAYTWPYIYIWQYFKNLKKKLEKKNQAIETCSVLFIITVPFIIRLTKYCQRYRWQPIGYFCNQWYKTNCLFFLFLFLLCLFFYSKLRNIYSNFHNVKSNK